MNMKNPQMTVRQLHEALGKLLDKYGDKPVTVWLPGSCIDLHQVIGPLSVAVSPRRNNDVLIEGNLRPGSALS